MDLSDPWQSLTALEILEKFECHAEALLTDPTFINTLEDWPGLQDLKAFTDKKWWKHRSRAQQRHQQRLRQQTSPESSTEPQSVDAVSFDLSQEDSNVDVETPAMELPNRTGRKGRSSLRPRLSSVSHTPGTPTRRNDSDSDVLIDLNAVFSDDELQHIKVPRDLSSSLKTKPTNKRFSYEYPSTNASKRPRNARNEAAPENPPNPQAVSFKFGRGRPPLITVPVQTWSSHCSNDRSKSPRTPNARRLSGVRSHNVHMSGRVQGRQRPKRKSTSTIVSTEPKFEML